MEKYRRVNKAPIKVSPELQKWFDTTGEQIYKEFIQLIINTFHDRRLDQEEDNRVKRKKHVMHVERLQSPIITKNISELPIEDQKRIMSYQRPIRYKDESLNILSPQRKPGRVGARR